MIVTRVTRVRSLLHLVSNTRQMEYLLYGLLVIDLMVSVVVLGYKCIYPIKLKYKHSNGTSLLYMTGSKVLRNT